MTIIRWRTQPNLERFINEAFKNQVEDNFNESLGSQPDTNIMKSKDNYMIEMAVPGLQKSDFSIKAEKDVLSISYEPAKENNDENSNITWLRREYKQEAFSRHFTLPETCDIDKISAGYENGILKVFIPFEDPEKTKITKSISIN
ncbi:MAG: Hsp20/alpha crystallin family protein [Bacteroidales bacterium]|nr:Hsp20/alpha crystallin family protein [Bacteroidales bacterium]